MANTGTTEGKGVGDLMGFKLGFDPLKPAALIDAEMHRECKRVRNLSNLQASTYNRACDCCGLPLVRVIQDAPLFPLCTPVLSLSDLGPGFPQYYWFVKYLFCIILLAFVPPTQAIAGLPSLISDYLANNYEEWQADSNWAITSSAGNQGRPENHTVLPLWQSILHIIAMILILISYYWLRTWLIQQENVIDEMMTTPSDYTVRIQGLKRRFDKEKLKEFLKNNGRSDGQIAQVVKMNIPIDISEYVTVVRDVNAIRSKLTYIERYVNERGTVPTHCCRTLDKQDLERKLEKLTQKLVKIEEKYASPDQKSSLALGEVFVTFQTQGDVTAVIENLSGDTITRFLRRLFGSGSFDSLLFERRPLNGKRAPEPSDIIWENLGAGFLKKWLLRCMTTFVTILILCICFAMIYGCTIYRQDINDTYTRSETQTFSDLSKNRMASILPALGVIAINFVLARLIRLFSSFEKITTFTGYNTSVAVKLTIAQCINTALIAIIVSPDSDDWFTPYGLVVNMTYIFISNTVVGALVSIISPVYLIKTIRKWSARRDKFLVQGQANTLYEGPPVDMAQRYANVAKTLIVVFAYAPIIPLGFLFGLATLVLDYWVDKILLLRRHARPLRMSGDMARVMVSSVPWAVMIYAIMNFIFIYELNEDDSAPAFIWMLIAICINILPLRILFQPILRKCCKWRVQADVPSANYEDEAVKFIDDYDRVNPVTQREGWEYYLNLIEGKNIISTEARNDLMMKLAQSGVSSLMKNYAGSRMPLDNFDTQFNPIRNNSLLPAAGNLDVMSVLRAQVAQRYQPHSQFHGYALPHNVEMVSMGLYTQLRGNPSQLRVGLDDTTQREVAGKKEETNLYPKFD